MPKETTVADKWRLILLEKIGASDTSYVINKGLICAEHFKPTDFVRKNRTELKKGSMPSIFNRIEKETVATVSIEEPDSPQIVQDANEICIDCERKDDIIIYQKKKIEDLQKQIKTLNDKTNYLKKAKTKIAAILLKMKNEKLVDDEVHKQLQVILVKYSLH